MSMVGEQETIPNKPNILAYLFFLLLQSKDAIHKWSRGNENVDRNRDKKVTYQRNNRSSLDHDMKYEVNNR